MRIVAEAEDINKYWEFVKDFPLEVRIRVAQQALLKAVLAAPSIPKTKEKKHEATKRKTNKKRTSSPDNEGQKDLSTGHRRNPSCGQSGATQTMRKGF
jgi:hypothetical protein